MGNIARNVLGDELLPCSYDPLTGFYREGCCETGPDDTGAHVLCARVTTAFLDFSCEHGNDLNTPRPEWRFAGLKPGDRWCVAVQRWLQALQAGVAPPVVLESTNAAALEYVSLEVLQQHAWRRTADGSPAA